MTTLTARKPGWPPWQIASTSDPLGSSKSYRWPFEYFVPFFYFNLNKSPKEVFWWRLKNFSYKPKITRRNSPKSPQTSSHTLKISAEQDNGSLNPSHDMFTNSLENLSMNAGNPPLRNNLDNVMPTFNLLLGHSFDDGTGVRSSLTMQPRVASNKNS